MHDQTHGELHFSLRVFKVELVLDYLDYWFCWVFSS